MIDIVLNPITSQSCLKKWIALRAKLTYNVVCSTVYATFVILTESVHTTKEKQ